jgi:Delta3,5-Delta2,4-dienoyl-CoA isomerase
MEPSIETIPHPILHHQYRFLDVSIPLINRHVIIVSLNRPTKRNAINSEMWSEIRRLFSEHIGRIGDGCRCVILTGSSLDTRQEKKSATSRSASSPGFCAGIDISDSNFQVGRNLRANIDNQSDPVIKGISFASTIREMQEAFTALERDCPVPIVAAVHGYCIGAGVDLIAAADIRWCASDAIFSVREVQLGLAADVGTLQRLPKIVSSDSWVRDVCFTGRSFNANEAASVGFVSRVVGVDSSEARPFGMNSRDIVVHEVLTKLCPMITSLSPVAVQGTKRSLVYSRDHSVADGLQHIADYNILALQSPDLTASFKLQERAKGNPKKTKASFADIPPFSKL